MRNFAVLCNPVPGSYGSSLWAMIPPIEIGHIVTDYVKTRYSPTERAMVITPCTFAGNSLAVGEWNVITVMGHNSAFHTLACVGYRAVADVNPLSRETVRNMINDGGATLSPDDLKPVRFDGGYVVSVKGREHVADRDATDSIRAAIVGNVAYARLHSAYVGIWAELGKVYIDVSFWIADRDNAIATGKANEQIAIWDVAGNCPIYLEEVK